VKDQVTLRYFTSLDFIFSCHLYLVCFISVLFNFCFTGYFFNFSFDLHTVN